MNTDSGIMEIDEENLVGICRQPPHSLGYKKYGSIPFDKIGGVRWDNVSGGVKCYTRHYFLYGYVSCMDIVGEIGHTCRHGDAPHEIKVCIVKKYTPKKLYNILAEQAGKKPIPLSK